MRQLKNVKGYFWGVGGAGVWWPGREPLPLTPAEKQAAKYREVEAAKDLFDPDLPVQVGGTMLWCPFNARLNSSTRCELGAAIIAMLSPYGLNIGIDNATVVERGNAIIEHQRRQLAQDIRDHKGTIRLGGGRARLHKSSPFKQRWALMQDGDLWQLFATLVRQRGPHSVQLTKVKGHATEQMVTEGKVTRLDKEGNDKADRAAELGATASQAKVQAFGRLYSQRQQEYRTLVCRIQKLSLIHI